MTTTSDEPGLYDLLAERLPAEPETRPNPSTTLTATIETLDNDRAFAASRTGSGLLLS